MTERSVEIHIKFGRQWLCGEDRNLHEEASAHAFQVLLRYALPHRVRAQIKWTADAAPICVEIPSGEQASEIERLALDVATLVRRDGRWRTYLHYDAAHAFAFLSPTLCAAHYLSEVHSTTASLPFDQPLDDALKASIERALDRSIELGFPASETLGDEYLLEVLEPRVSAALAELGDEGLLLAVWLAAEAQILWFLSRYHDDADAHIFKDLQLRMSPFLAGARVRLGALGEQAAALAGQLSDEWTARFERSGVRSG